MLTLFIVEAYLINRWHRRGSIKYLWSKLTSCFYFQPFAFTFTNPRFATSLGFGTVAVIKYDKVLKVSNIDTTEGEGRGRRTSRLGSLAKVDDISEMSIEEKFRAAVKVIHSLPKDGPYQPSNGTKLKFYGLFKQATEGECNVTRPAFWDMVGRYKWDAWNKNGSMTKEEAMMAYVEGLKEIVETMSFNGDVQDFLDSIGPFYEFVNLQGSKMNHIKEKIDTLTSSSSNSSNSNSNSSSTSHSVATSPVNSCPNSPLRNIQDAGLLSNGTRSTVDTEVDSDDTVESKEGKAQVQVDARTATFETFVTKATVHNGNHNPTSYMSQSQTNSFEQKVDRQHEHFNSNSVIPPPTPIHTYAHRNGYVKQTSDEADIEEEEGDEQGEGGEVVMRIVPLSPKVPSTTSFCKEDLEKDPNDSILIENHVPVSNKFSIENLATTSGTESEKYYSGDSEPEVDERFTNYYSQATTPPSNNESNPGTSRSCTEIHEDNVLNYASSYKDPPRHHHQRGNHNNTQVKISALSSESEFMSNGGQFIRRSRERSSPKRNGGDGLNQFIIPLGSSPSSLQHTGDMILHSTVERLNRDVDHILARLRILETAYATSAEGRSSSPRDQPGRQRRRLFGELSKSSVAFIVMWPFAVHFLIKLISWWWRRRRALIMARRLN